MQGGTQIGNTCGQVSGGAVARMIVSEADWYNIALDECVREENIRRINLLIHMPERDFITFTGADQLVHGMHTEVCNLKDIDAPQW